MGIRHTAKGFTMPELLIALGIIGVVVLVVVAAFSNFGYYFALQTASQDVHTALIDARQATVAAQDDTMHGVHIDENEVVRFIGPVYDSASTTNIVYPFPNGVVATSALTGGVVDVVFTRLTGATQSSGTITLTEPRGGASNTITIYQSGLIAY